VVAALSRKRGARVCPVAVGGGGRLGVHVGPWLSTPAGRGADRSGGGCKAGGAAPGRRGQWRVVGGGAV